MMLERLIFYASSGLVTALAAWVGVAAILQARKRFGHGEKLPLWLLFIILWMVTTLAGFVGGAGASGIITPIAVVVLVIGILVYLVSLPITRKVEEKKTK